MNYRDIERAAREQGFKVELTSKGHHKFVPPDATKNIVIASGTPSDVRALQNLIGQLRRSGFKWPWPWTK